MISNEREFWSLGFSEWGRWQLRKAPAADPTDYTLIEDLGPVLLGAALEFDGDFQILGEDIHFSLQTEGLPWLFLITAAGTLYVKQAGENISTAMVLSTGVTQVSACRSFRSRYYNTDSGFVVAFLKEDGSVYTRVRTEPSPGNYVWSEEAVLEAAGTGNTRVQVLRLNDFRTGIYVCGCNKIFVTPRTYIGDTVKTEHLCVHLEDSFHTIPFRNEPEDGVDDLIIESVERQGNQAIRIHANYPLCDRDPLWARSIELTSTQSGQAITALRFEDGDMIFELALPIQTYEKDVFTSWIGNRLGYIVSPRCIPVWPVLTFTLNPPPLDAGLEHVFVNLDSSLSVGFTEIVASPVAVGREHAIIDIEPTLTVDFSEIEQSNADVSREHIYVHLTVPTITLTMTQVGPSPI